MGIVPPAGRALHGALIDACASDTIESGNRNRTRGNFILNAVIDRDGRVPEADLRRLKELGDEIRRRFGKSLAETSGGGEIVELALGAPATVDHAIIMETITEGERIRGYVIEGVIEGVWTELAKGTCVGHKRIERFKPVRLAKVRLRVTDSVAPPIVRMLAVYGVESL